jgi:hypothetical protein
LPITHIHLELPDLKPKKISVLNKGFRARDAFPAFDRQARQDRCEGGRKRASEEGATPDETIP